MGVDVFRRDLNSFNYVNSDRQTTFEQLTTGFQIRGGVPITEYLSASVRYGLSQDDVTLEPSLFFTDSNGDLIRGNSAGDACDPLVAGRYLCDALGNRTTSSIGASLIYDDRDNRVRPTRGQSIVGSVDFAGLGGSVKYIRGRLNASKHWRVLGDFIFTASAEGGYIHPLENRSNTAGDGIDDVRLTDRFFLGEPQIRGFDIRGVGPRVVRSSTIPGLDTNGNPINVISESSNLSDDAIGGRAYYLGRAELEIPLGSGARELGLRPSIFLDVGAVFNVVQPLLLTDLQTQASSTVDSQGNASPTGLSAPLYLTTDATGAAATTFDATTNGVANSIATSYTEQFFGDTMSPRLSVGFGVNWNSPFGPFRIDIAKALLKEPGDDTKLFTFNVGTQF